MSEPIESDLHASLQDSQNVLHKLVQEVEVDADKSTSFVDKQQIVEEPAAHSTSETPQVGVTAPPAAPPAGSVAYTSPVKYTEDTSAVPASARTGTDVGDGVGGGTAAEEEEGEGLETGAGASASAVAAASATTATSPTSKTTTDTTTTSPAPAAAPTTQPTGDSASEGTPAASTDTATPESIAEQIEYLQDIEIAMYLERVGKQVQEIKARSSAVDATQLPKLTDYTDESGNKHYIRFYRDYFALYVASKLPHTLVDLDPDDADAPRLSYSLLKNYAERVYMLFPDNLAQLIVEGRLAKVWMWQSHWTWKLLAGYVVLWWYNLILVSALALSAVVLLRLHFFPPSAAARLRMAEKTSHRAVEAKKMSNEFEYMASVGVPLKEFQNKISKRFVRLANSWRSDGNESSDTDDEYAVSRNKTGVEKVVEKEAVLEHGTEAKTETAATEATKEKATAPATAPDAPTSDAAGDAAPPPSAYQNAYQVVGILAPSLLELTDSLVDLGEKVRNIIVHPEHPATPMIALRILAGAVALYFVPVWLIAKAFWAYIAVEVFLLWKLRTELPAYRHALNPIRWFLLGAPNDADYMIYIIAQRKKEGKPLRGIATLKRMEKERDEKRALASAKAAPKSKYIPEIRRDHKFFTTIAQTELTEDSHFATYQGLPGTLTLKDDSLVFTPGRGMNQVKGLFSRKKSDASESKDVILTGITQINKRNRLGLPGLIVTCSDGQEHRFSNVSGRDELFNMVISKLDFKI